MEISAKCHVSNNTRPGCAHKGLKVSKPQGYLHSHPCTWHTCQYPCLRSSQDIYQEMNGYGACSMGTNRLLLSHKEECHKVIFRHMTGVRDYGKQKKCDSHKYLFQINRI